MLVEIVYRFLRLREKKIAPTFPEPRMRRVNDPVGFRDLVGEFAFIGEGYAVS